MNKETIISVLIRLLQEPRDGLILINGEWGVGKTYFLQFEFRNFYKKASHFYMSALGLNSLQDFKDRMLSVTYLDNSSEIKKLSELTASATSAISQEESLGKFTEQVLSTFSGAMKDYVLKDLCGIFVIDDLERIPQELRDEIATYCLQNYQKDQRLDYILVGNFSEQSDQILNHKEKIISDEIYFSINNISEILEQKLKIKNESHRNTITKTIIDFEETNLRIINRVIVKLSPLIEGSEIEDDISEIDIKNLTSSLCAHIILKEKFAYRENDFRQNYLSSSLKTLTNISNDKTEQISKEESNLLNITAYKSYNNLMVPYCFNIISKTDILPYLFPRKQKLQKSDYAALAQPELYDISERDYLDEVEKVILKKNNPKLSIWLMATYNYLRLSQSNYLPTRKGLTKKAIQRKKTTFSDEEIKIYFSELHPNIDDIPLHVLRRDNDDIHNFFVDKYKEIKNLEKINELRDKMINEGWCAIDADIYQSKFQFNLLEKLNVDMIISAIKTKWTIRDINTFSNHLASLYNFSNLSDFLSGELPYLKKLHSALNSHHKGISKSFRKGAIMQLTDTVGNVKKALEDSIADKAINP
ncbi:TPA: ATP-binding protein [Escherichia coli]|nr:ATP-binding protein [Escherichia coli]HAO3117504.1 ATP-binding protein [Escherichia coli]HAO3122200.1 ATP-binding protein [Escherichia coli]HDB9115410.1 ATP-binding protein [Escherichia coli]HDC4964013.1 ATP-binding protein [Escherichia coli]